MLLTSKQLLRARSVHPPPPAAAAAAAAAAARSTHTHPLSHTYQFTCCTSTEVQILTLETSTEVQILTHISLLAVLVQKHKS